MKITVRKHVVRGNTKWVVGRREGGKRTRSSHDSKAEAEAEAARLRSDVAAMGTSWTDLPAGERAQLVAVWCAARDKGLDLAALVNSPPKSAPATKAPAIEDVLVEMETAKTKAGRDEMYVQTLHNLMSEFIKGRERMPVDQFSVHDIEKFMDTKSPKYRQTLRSRLSTFFSFAVRRGHLIQNPCDRLEATTTPHTPPTILTVAETQKAVDWLKVHPQWLAWFALSAFAGLRPEEAAGTEWKAINFTEASIVIEAQTSKTRQRRVVYPLPMCMAWLKEAKRLKSTLPLTVKARTIGLRLLKVVLGWPEWKSDVTRHSAASYWLAQCGSAATVATALGHSESILRKNYMALVTKAEAARFWAILPTPEAAKKNLASPTPDTTLSP